MTINYPPGVLVGIELEFVSSEYRGELGQHFNSESDLFSVGSDSSAVEAIKRGRFRSHGIEIRFRRPVNIIDVDRLDFELELVKEVANPVVTRSCGYHIHVSWQDWDEAANQLKLELQKHFTPKYAFAERAIYCNGTRTCGDGVNPKYVPVRNCGPNHYEIRTLNSTLKLRGVLQPLKKLKGITDEIQRQLTAI